MLVPSISGKNDIVGVDVVLCGGGDALCLCHPDHEATKHNTTENAQRLSFGQLIGKKKSSPERNRHIDNPEQHGRAHQTEIGDKKNRKQ